MLVGTSKYSEKNIGNGVKNKLEPKEKRINTKPKVRKLSCLSLPVNETPSKILDALSIPR
jgi:hypothetical protein